MKNVGLKWRIALIGLIPMMFFIVLASVSIKKDFRGYLNVTETRQSMTLIESISAVVHETQKERGVTAGYLNGGMDLAALNFQRTATNKKLTILKKTIFESSLTSKYQKELLSNIKELELYRSNVTEKTVSTKEAIVYYSQFISVLLNTEIFISDKTTFGDISSALRTLAIFEIVKENGGKLRANMTGVFSKDTQVSEDVLNAIFSLKFGMEQNLISKGIVMHSDASNVIDSFNSSVSWKSVLKSYNILVNKKDEGKFGINPTAFFQEITLALNIVKELVDVQVKHVLDKSRVLEENLRNKLIVIICLLILAIISLIFATFRSVNSISLALSNVVGQLTKRSNVLTNSSKRIASSSIQLADGTTQQASSLQETVTSVDQISAMVNRNSEYSDKSKKVSVEGKRAATQGKTIIENMIDSINDISSSNTSIANQMNVSNKEISEIVKVITEIDEKTKVINDIVFQTKLLSFNASVEAARAGEHGKGFAVVAEEVGNLAQMSGNAAKEISEMLDSSIRKVESIVDNTKERVEELIVVGQNKVDHGINVANECGESLDEIVNNVTSINEMVSEITNASREQAQGVQEITKAMNLLDQMTQQNASIAKESSEHSKDLDEQAVGLNHIVTELTRLITGKMGYQSEAMLNSTINTGPHNIESHNIAPKVEQQDNIVYIPNSDTSDVDNTHINEIKVSGSDINIPSADDPRFEDI